MKKEEIFEKLQCVFRDVFDNNDIKLTLDTVAEDIDEWDSLSHIQLAKELEKAFNVKFSAQDILSWDNVGEMVETILLKLS